ncbi:lactonase family protein [uncultured Polaribacter sp.]|uniref:lactonase family protein n=1 Tax=uncultured Polaribacter sp. TaxID=174711 RepID=UPI00260960D2|nr:lactonase family protein [uncultured Polaribacter sp.]
MTKHNKTLLFVGSFTDKKAGEGIHVYEFNNETGESILKSTINNITNTSFLKLSSNGKHLYSVVDSQMKYNGKVAAFKVDVINTKISLLNMQDCGGVNPAHLEIDKTGSYLVNSNYSDGSLSVFKINYEGSLEKNNQILQFKDSSVLKSRQKSSHIHSANFSPDNKYVFVHDLGADKIRRFTLNTSKVKLENQEEIKVKPGNGPRHFTFHPKGKFGYGINELSGTIDAYQYENGNLNFIEDYFTYQQKQEVYRAADIHISSDGKFLYASNRGPKEDSIVVFLINQKNGKLKLVEHFDTGGKHPRNFAISPNGKFLLVANQFTNNIIIFKINFKTGKLIKLQNEIRVNSPSSLQLKEY